MLIVSKVNLHVPVLNCGSKVFFPTSFHNEYFHSNVSIFSFIRTNGDARKVCLCVQTVRLNPVHTCKVGISTSIRILNNK